jgi:hypothetical protein
VLALQQAIRILQQDILAGLAAHARLPGGPSLTADRISLTLGLQLAPNHSDRAEDGLFAVATDSASCPHHVTVEFKLTSITGPTGGDSASGQSTTATTFVTPESENALVAALSEIFGAPGFDSAARASVFREALEELSDDQRRQVLTTLSLRTEPIGEEAAVSRSRRLVRRLAASGPAGIEHGAQLLATLAAQSPGSQLIRLAAERWRTQSEMTSTAPAVE